MPHSSKISHKAGTNILSFYAFLALHLLSQYDIYIPQDIIACPDQEWKEDYHSRKVQAGPRRDPLI